MTRRFQIKTVPSHLLAATGRRLDCGPYMSGVLEAREKLARLTNESLSRVTTGIFHAGRESRQWVESPDYGVPFLGSTDILAADLSHLPYIAKKQVQSNPSFILQEGYTLITRSGTIGRMAYCRSDMEGMACSEHAMRVVPDSEVIRPGYLYAFLSGRFGVPLVVAGTYGSIIQSIEPEHIANLPVPRLGEVEPQAHDLVQRAAQNRVAATRLLEQARALVESHLQLSVDGGFNIEGEPFVSQQTSSLLGRRMDAYHYNRSALRSRALFQRACELHSGMALREVAEVWTPGIFKRLYVDDPAFGVPYFTGQQTYELSPTSDSYLRSDVAREYRLLLERGMVIVQDSGQVYGLIGRPVFVGKALDGMSCSNHQIRIKCESDVDAGYLFALLDTQAGTGLLKGEASGSSVPNIDEGRAKHLRIPWPIPTIREEIASGVLRALDLRDDAIDADNQARLLVEQAIERGCA